MLASMYPYLDPCGACLGCVESLVCVAQFYVSSTAGQGSLGTLSAIHQSTALPEASRQLTGSAL